MDRVVDTQLRAQFKLYNTICAEFWKLCFLGNRLPSLQASIHVSGSRGQQRSKTAYEIT